MSSRGKGALINSVWGRAPGGRNSNGMLSEMLLDTALGALKTDQDIWDDWWFEGSSGTAYHEGVLLVTVAATLTGTDQFDGNNLDGNTLTVVATISGSDQADFHELGSVVSILAILSGNDQADFHEVGHVVDVLAIVSGFDFYFTLGGLFDLRLFETRSNRGRLDQRDDREEWGVSRRIVS